MLIDGFNEVCNNIASGYMKVGDDSMSAIRSRNTANGDLPHLYYISAIRNHWGHSSIMLPVLSLGPSSLLIQIEVIKVQRRASTICILVKCHLVTIS